MTLAARTQAEIEAAAAAIRARGGKADALALDVTDLDAVQRADRGAPSRSTSWSTMPAPTGPSRSSTSRSRTSTSSWALNVRAAFFVAQAVARRLIEAKQPGSIINISSQMGHVGAARRTVYCASKQAMEGFTKAMAIELAPHGIRVNTLAPTFIETPMTRPFFEDQASATRCSTRSSSAASARSRT